MREVSAAGGILTSSAKPARAPEQGGGKSLRDHALLVRLLARAPGASPDPPELARRLLDRFGDLRRTVTAEVSDLGVIAGEAAAAELRLSYDLALAVLQQPLRERDVISS